MAPDHQLNPAQQEVIALLGKGGDRPEFPEGLASDLEGALVDELEPIATLLEGRPELKVNKHELATVHGCEAHYLDGRDREFRWTPAAARGQVSHKAIELYVNWQGEPYPAELVDEAVGRLIDADRSISSYLEGLGAAEQAELRSAAVDRVTKFQECFPRPKREWCPVTESSVWLEFLDGSLRLGGKTDLTLGRPGEKVVIDLKSGGTAGPHREDLRYYALLETMRLGLPPWKLATYYLDSARAHVENVTEPLLWAAVRRTVDGVVRIVELVHRGRDAATRPGPTCRWCPLQEECGDGSRYLVEADDPDGGVMGS